MVAPGKASKDLLPNSEGEDRGRHQDQQSDGKHQPPPKLLLLLEEHVRVCEAIHIIANCNQYITICDQVNVVLSFVFRYLRGCSKDDALARRAQLYFRGCGR